MCCFPCFQALRFSFRFSWIFTISQLVHHMQLLRQALIYDHEGEILVISPKQRDLRWLMVNPLSGENLAKALHHLSIAQLPELLGILKTMKARVSECLGHARDVHRFSMARSQGVQRHRGQTYDIWRHISWRLPGSCFFKTNIRQNSSGFRQVSDTTKPKFFPSRLLTQCPGAVAM